MSKRSRKQAHTGLACMSEASPPTGGRASEGEVDSTSRTETLRRLYAALLRCRRVQERLQSASGIAAATFDIALGHEAVAVGATAEMTSSDTITASSRNVAALLAKGAPVSELLARNGASPGSIGWAAPSVPEDPFNAGVGIALAHRLEQKRGVVVALCAQPQPPLGGWHNALGFAVAHKLPIILVIESNAEADSPASDAAPHLHPLSFMVRDHDFPGIVVDGSDVVAVWRVTQESVHRARRGLGPTLIDCRTDPRRDPLAYMERYLRKRKAWNEDWRQNLESEIAAALAKP